MNTGAPFKKNSPAGTPCGAAPAPEDTARAGLYGLLARLLLQAPDASLLNVLAGWNVEMASTDRFGTALTKLARCAAALPPQQVADEFAALFISSGAPRIIPNASLYLAGFLHEAPLVALRDDLAALGFVRSTGLAETEDHLALLCDTMRVLISADTPAVHVEFFFEKHLASWAPRCLADLRRESGDGFYARVADLAAIFFAIEGESFRYDDTLEAA